MELVARDESGAPIFGRDEIEGWDVARKIGTDQERTLRNAVLAAFRCEAKGDIAKAYKIWTYQLKTGETLWEAVSNALPHHVAYLGGGMAGFTWTAKAVQARIDTMCEAIGSRPALAHWERDGVKVCLWEWPDSKTWLAVEFNTSKMARPLQARPDPAQKQTVMDRMGIDCTEPHDKNALGDKISADPHTKGDCHTPTMADRLGEDLPGPGDHTPSSDPSAATGTGSRAATPGNRSAGNAPSATGGGNGTSGPIWPGADDVAVLRVSHAQPSDAPHKLSTAAVKFLLALHPQSMRKGKAQRESKKAYRACEVCREPIMWRGPGVDSGVARSSDSQSEPDRYVTITGRRRAHLPCARDAHPRLAALVKDLPTALA